MSCLLGGFCPHLMMYRVLSSARTALIRLCIVSYPTRGCVDYELSARRGVPPLDEVSCLVTHELASTMSFQRGADFTHLIMHRVLSLARTSPH